MEEQKNLNFESIQGGSLENELPRIPEEEMPPIPAGDPMEEDWIPDLPEEPSFVGKAARSVPDLPIAWNGPIPPVVPEPVAAREVPQPSVEEADFEAPCQPKAEEQPAAEQSQPVAEQSQPTVEQPQPAAEQYSQWGAAAQTAPHGAAYTGPSSNGSTPYGQAPYGYGTYSYQNPNPYQNYQWQTPPPPRKKDRNRPFVIATLIAVGIIALCCLAVLIAEISSIGQWMENSRPQDGVVETPYEKGETNEEDAGEESAKRQEGAVYNVPEISPEKKKGEALSLIEINKKVKDSVVGILIATKSGEETEFSGSGFIISENGYIITNEHVVSDAAQVKVVLSDGITEYQAVIVGKDSQADLAILKVEAKGLAAAVIGDSGELEVGETVVAIGNPYGMVLAGSMTDGIVSALNRKIEINGSFMTLIQTNASINPGNSGGPLVNAYGQVVGICSSKLVATNYEGIGFAIPINDVVNLADELINYGHIRTRAYIGIMGYDLAEDYCEYHGIPQGVYVSYVDPNCEAAKKGMKEGDIIIGFNGQEISSMAQLNELKNEFRPGDTVKVKVWRDEKELEFEITLQESDD